MPNHELQTPVSLSPSLTAISVVSSNDRLPAIAERRKRKKHHDELIKINKELTKLENQDSVSLQKLAIKERADQFKQHMQMLNTK